MLLAICYENAEKEKMAEASGAESPVHFLYQVGKILNAEGVRWGAIGALALAYHGWVRASMDADALITLQESGTNLNGLADRLRSQGWDVETRLGDDEDPLGFVLRIRDAGGNQVDLIGAIRRADPGIFDRILSVELEGMVLWVTSLEDLVALKVFAGSHRDLDDAAKILEVAKDVVDKNLLLQLCRQFGPREETACKRLLKQHDLL